MEMAVFAFIALGSIGWERSHDIRCAGNAYTIVPILTDLQFFNLFKNVNQISQFPRAIIFVWEFLPGNDVFVTFEGSFLHRHSGLPNTTVLVHKGVLPEWHVHSKAFLITLALIQFSNACWALPENSPSADETEQTAANPAASAQKTESAGQSEQAAFSRIPEQTSLPALDAATLDPIRLSEATPQKRFPQSKFKPLPLPPEPAINDVANRSIDMSVFRVINLNQGSILSPMRLEASYNQVISLREALDYALLHNLPIKIARSSWDYQRYQLLAAITQALPLPGLAIGYSQTWSQVASPATTANARVFQALINYPLFQGGGQFFNMLTQYYRAKGFRQAYAGNINDTLLQVYVRYENLVLQQALLQIRAKFLEESQAQLDLNTSQYTSGNGTQFAIMQARTQLAAAQQALLQQQVEARKASLALAFSLNFPTSINLIACENSLGELSLLDEGLPVNALINVALTSRPEIRQYEMFRLAAQRNVWIYNNAIAGWYPSLSFFTAYTWARTDVNPTNSPGISGLAVAEIASTQTPVGAATNNALGQTASFSPNQSLDFGDRDIATALRNTSSTSASRTAESTDINTINTPVVAGSGGLPLNLVQSGSLVISGAVAPSIAGGNGGFTGATGATNLNGATISSFGVFPGTVNAYQAGFSLNWFVDTLLPDVFNVFQARALARQSLLQVNQQLLQVNAQVRGAYLSALTARDQIGSVAYGVASAREALNQANLRLQGGQGTNLELITARRNYLNAVLAQAHAILASNVSQARLLHDMGVISVDSLTHGYKLPADNIRHRKRSNP